MKTQVNHYSQFGSDEAKQTRKELFINLVHAFMLLT